MSRLFALLAGINRYHPQSDANVSQLHGCRNDILSLQSFLEDRFPAGQRALVTLLDNDATYQNVIDHFGRELLLKAGPGDVVLFAYAGHGSQEGAAPEFLKYYPEGKEETLVLYDSRIPGGLDLADKELAVLIERVAARGAHVAVLLDSCHSGSATRGMEEFIYGAVRQTSSRTGARPLESYLQGEYLKRTDFYLPNSRHISLAACDRTEKAFELTSQRGLFSTKLLQTLEKTGGQITYADLYTQCRLGMAQITDQQHPQFDTYGYFNGYDAFLNLGAGSSGKTLRVFFMDNTWQATMGAVHGLPVASGNPATFEILKNGEVLGRVRSRVVGMESSSLEQPAFSLAAKETYEARLTSLPAPRTVYLLRGEAAQVQEAQLALQNFRPLHFDLSADALQAGCRLEVSADRLQLFRTADGARLRTIEGTDRAKMFADAFDKLEQIARWEKTLELDNRETRINHNDVELVLVEMDQAGTVLRKTTDRDIVIDILRVNNEDQKVPFRLEIRNKNAAKARHCALFYADDSYGFHPVGYNEQIPAQSTAIAMDKNPGGVQYAFELNGKTETTDIFKLFVSNSKISGEGLQQNGFPPGETVDYWTTRGGARGDAVSQARAIFGMSAPTQQEDVNDWYAITLRIRSVARQAGVGNQAVSLANDFIKIRPHRGFRSGMALASANSGSRSIEPMSVIAELARHSGVDLLPFGASTRDAAPLNMLELTDIQNEAALARQPLQIEIAAQLQEKAGYEDLLLPLTFDGQHLLPLGKVKRLANGNALVSINRLPAAADQRRRSLGKALKLCFLKLVLKKEDVQQLCWADYSRETAERRSDNLPAKVAAAQNILLVTHGIIGDSKCMAECMRRAYNEKLFDLVLTFDYENLNTKIEVTAARLADKLKAAGITPGSGKKITILAHSMGGLVCRYFIENLQGNKVVSQLIMAGTPNGGSAIAKLTNYRDFLIPIITLAINSAWGIPAAGVLLAILKHSKMVTPTLEQMYIDHPDGFLKNLAKTADPGVRYSIVAGNLHDFLNSNAEQKALMDKLLGLGGKLFYGKEPNDLAVSIESIKAVPATRKPAPEAVVVAGNHLNYFEEEGCVGAIMGFVKNPTP